MPSPPGGYGPPQPQPNATLAAAPSAPPMAPIPMPPQRAKRSRAAGVALGGIVTLLVAGGGATGILLCTGGKKFDSRIPLDKAPPITISLISGPAHGDLGPSDSATKEAMTSSLAAKFCGGVDIVGELFAARYREAASAANSLEALRDPLRATDALKCGKSLAESMEGRMVVQLGFFDGQTPRRVAALKHKSPINPFVGFVETSFGSLVGRCTPPGSRGAAPRSGGAQPPNVAPRDGQKGNGPCSETGAAGFADASVYYGGLTEDVSFFASAYKARGGAPNAGEPTETLSNLAKKLDPADSWELRYRPESIDLSLPCSLVAPSEAVGEVLKLCLPPGHEGDGAALASDVKAFASVRERPESGHSVGFEYVLWARDEDSAKNAQTKLNAYVDVWKRTIEQNEQAILKIVGAGKDPRDSAYRAVARTWIAALKKPEVLVNGEIVRLRIKKALLDDDKAQIKTLLLATSEDVQKAGLIVDALIEAKSAPPEAVSHFLGPGLSAWVLAPDATVDDCRAIAKHANDMSNAPDFDQFLPMTEMIESWGGAVPENEKEQIKIDEKLCSQRRLSPESKACLVGAKTIAEMAKCEAPVSPDTATFKARIQGKWRAGLMAGGDAWERQKTAERSRGSLFSVEGGNASLTGGYDELRGELSFIYVRNTVVPELGGEATLARINVGGRRAELTFIGDKLFLATWDPATGKKKPAILLERMTADK